MELALTLTSGIAWTIVYLVAIGIGFKQKTYAVPLVAIALNISWEALYSYDAVYNHIWDAQTIINLVWFVFDIIIVSTFFMFGRESFPKNLKRGFVPLSIFIFVAALAAQLICYFTFDNKSVAAQYSAITQNVLMSFLFLLWPFTQRVLAGQSRVIALCKWLGTLAPTILMGFIYDINLFVIIAGVVCCVLDVAYFMVLRHKHNSIEKNVFANSRMFSNRPNGSRK